MSGTSLDAVDAAMILTDGEKVLEFGPVAERKYTLSERAVLQSSVALARAWDWQGREPDHTAAARVITKTHSDAWQMIMAEWKGPMPCIAGIHGQTVLHKRPSGTRPGATRQIIDAEALQAELGLPIAYDFRSEDVRAGGEGAPLAPVYHRALLKRNETERAAVLNLGGVGNITLCEPDGSLTAFDTGPANGPIDEWIEAHARGTYDVDGKIAGAGTVHEGLLAQLLEHPYFDEAPPKSLDRYDFNANLVRGLSLEDGAATLAAFCAKSVARALEHAETRPTRLIISGGGRHNPVLMQMLDKYVPCKVLPAEGVGWRGDSIEAEAFALLAVRVLRGLPLSYPMTTGVPHPVMGGVLLGV